MNQHTCGAVFNAYALASRLDLALATWDKLSAQGFDIGPFGSSALIKACARQRNVRAALQVGCCVGSTGSISAFEVDGSYDDVK